MMAKKTAARKAAVRTTDHDEGEESPAAEPRGVPDGGGETAAKKSTAKKTTTKKAATKRATTAKAAAKKTAVRKTAAKKAAGEKAAAPAAQAVKKAAAGKKTAAKKTAGKKTAAKKASADQAGAHEAGAAGPVAKKAAAKKSTAKKAGAARAAKQTGATTVVAKKTPGTAGTATTAQRAVPKARAVAAEPGELAVRPGEDPWTPAEVEEARTGLLSEGARLRAEIASSEEALAGLMRDSGGGAGDDDADTGTKNITREHELSLAANARETLLQTEHALQRLDAGTYGLCENCGNPIGKARMQAFPRATLCVECKQKQERRY
ncbi:TraR/DksA family transcriptional regulator [Streptomyces sp. NPDC087294]|uniref:TraR/DksA family transcriptional regulator n=1 Tax=Streptomyces sp. NPDC087294 TaxID=3365777 RepID=UPI00380A0930